jgi:hypothetical protein
MRTIACRERFQRLLLLQVPPPFADAKGGKHTHAKHARRRRQKEESGRA